MLELFITLGIVGLFAVPMILRKVPAIRTGITGAMPAINWRTWGMVALLIGFWVFWIWFFPDTVPGKWVLGKTGFSSQNEWYPWVMQYLPTALLVLIGWRIFFASPSATSATGTKSGGGLTTLAVWAVIIGGILLAFYTMQTWKDNRPTGPLVATYVFHGLGAMAPKEVDRTGRMEVHFQAPVRVNWYVCGRVVGPAIVRSHSDKPEVELKTLQAPPGWHYYEFSNKFVAFLKENDVRTPLLVEFTLREGPTPATCPK